MKTDYAATCRKLHSELFARRRAPLEALMSRSKEMGMTAKVEAIHGTHWVDFMDEEDRCLGRLPVSETEASLLSVTRGLS